ncbi:MAG TPA: HupE/UreJ family protein [Xanthobacteraceae bacterium]|nr:HupE/UreJ family protein [Xanthobacteraceae bacterium]
MNRKCRSILARFLDALLVAVLVLGPGFSIPAAAHTRSESHSAWLIKGNTVHLQFTVPDLESKRITPDGEMPSVEQLGDYIAGHVGAFSGDDACKRTEGPRPVATAPGYRRYEFTFECPSDDDIKVNDSAWFELVETHTNFAQIQTDDGQFIEQLITKDQQTLDVSASAASPLQNAGFLTFLEMGMEHIFTGIDHMSFMLGLVLISRRIRDLLFVVTGFTIGHSLTLGLAVTGVLRPDAQFIDALVAFTIAMIGAENLGDSTHKPLVVALGMGGLMVLLAVARHLGAPVILPTALLIGAGIFGSNYLMLTGHMRDAGRVRLVMTLVFGLIHGFGFASNLLDMKLPSGRLAQLLFGFNFGVEIAQVIVVLTAVLIAAILVKLRMALPRPIVTDIAASFLVAEGLVWFLSRTIVFS